MIVLGYQYKVVIEDVEYGMSDLKSVQIQSPLFNKFSVGNACSAELNILFWPKQEVPAQAKIVPYVFGNDGEWIQLGVFYTYTKDESGDKMNIIAYDAMLKADTVWEPSESDEFPMTMQNVVTKFASLMGIDVDSRTAINQSYTVDYPVNDYTLRDVLCFIAGANAGNWIITREGKLLLVPIFASLPEETSYLVSEDGDAIMFGDVRILV